MSDFNFPEEWVRTQLGDVLEYGKCEKAEPSSINDDAWVLELEDIERDSSKVIQFLTFADRQSKSTKNKFKKGDVLYGKLRPYLNKVVVAHSDGVCTTEIIPLNGGKFLNNKYIFYWLKTAEFLTYVTTVGYGVNMPRLGTEDGKAAPFVLAPLAEQQQIAQKLDELLAQVDTLKTRLDAIPKILKRFRQSVLAAAVSGRLTEEWRGSDEYEVKGNKYLPLNWKSEQAQNVCLKVQSGSTPRDNPFDQNGSIPFLKVYNIVNQKVDFNYKPQFVTADVHEKSLKRSIALPNDILMNIVGPPLGKVAVLTNQYPEWNLNQAITLFRTNPECLQFMYLYYVLCEGELVRDVMPETKGSVGQVNISLSQCREALIPVPPLEEQTEIVRRVEQLFAYADQIEKRVKDAQARVNHLTQSILAKAFRGELTADWRAQNPELISGENSAAALLERIKAEREAAGKSKRKVKA